MFKVNRLVSLNIVDGSNVELSRDEVLSDYRLMVRARRTDEAEIALQKTGRAKFAIVAGGHEGAGVGVSRILKPGDWIAGYYRFGVEGFYHGNATPKQFLSQVIGDPDITKEPSSAGRMMGRHTGTYLLDRYGDQLSRRGQVNIASISSPTGSQAPVGLGLARTTRFFQENPVIASAFPTLTNNGNEIAVCTVGDSSAAEGFVWEAIAQSVVQKSPVLWDMRDNRWGISVPGHLQIPHDSLSRAYLGFEPQSSDGDGMPIWAVNSWDYRATKATFAAVDDWMRETGNPAMVHSMVTQPFGHSTSGDHRRYKTPEQLQWDRDNDSITKLRTLILTQGLATEAELDEIEAEERESVLRAKNEAWNEYQAPIDALAQQAEALSAHVREDIERVVSGDGNRFLVAIDKQIGVLAKLKNEDAINSRGKVQDAVRRVLFASLHFSDLSSRQSLVNFHNSQRALAEELYSSNVYAPERENVEYVSASYSAESVNSSTNYIIAAALHQIFKDDPLAVTFGEDTAKLGGVAHCTFGLQGGLSVVPAGASSKMHAIKKYLTENGFGESRVYDHAIAENSIVGAAIGMALRGLHPIVEIQYLDYLVCALEQIVDELACLRYRTAGGQSAPMLIRTHGHRLEGMWHAGSPMGMILSSAPGLRVLVPRNGAQAAGMYRAAMESGDPVLSVEPLKKLRRDELLPDNLEDIYIPLGHSEVLREAKEEKGMDSVTIVTYGYCCDVAMAAAAELEELGVEVEVVDLQSLSPLDKNGVALQSILKTKKVLFFDEDVPEGAMAIISKKLLADTGHYKDIEIMDHLTAPSHKPAYGEDGDHFTKPQTTDVIAKVLEIVDEANPGEGWKPW